jgi:thiol:disulfide interchange protein
MKLAKLGIFALALGLMSFVFLGKKPAADEGIQFKKISFEQALKEAKVSNKLIFMDAYAEWCGPCKYMAANVFTDAEVGKLFNDEFINLKIDMEKGEGPALAAKFQVRAYPTLFFIDGDGNVVKKVLGAQPADKLIAIGNEAKK